MRVGTLALFVFFLFSPRVFAYPLCSNSSAVGSVCTIAITGIHPTQTSVGMIEVTHKAKKISNLDPAELEEYFNEQVVPVVMGPGGIACSTDHHHFVRAALAAGFKYVYAVVKENWSHLSVSRFWNEMLLNRWIYLFDENGKALSSYLQLPTTIDQLKDDPFRSLAWSVREKGCYLKTDEEFAEFKWADFFRTRVSIDGTKKGYSLAIQAALKLCHTSAAVGLPGYLP